MQKNRKKKLINNTGFFGRNYQQCSNDTSLSLLAQKKLRTEKIDLFHQSINRRMFVGTGFVVLQHLFITMLCKQTNETWSKAYLSDAKSTPKCVKRCLLTSEDLEEAKRHQTNLSIKPLKLRHFVLKQVNRFF